MLSLNRILTADLFQDSIRNPDCGFGSIFHFRENDGFAGSYSELMISFRSLTIQNLYDMLVETYH